MFNYANLPVPLDKIIPGSNPIVGLINPGEIFVWEPYLPHARELCIVVKTAVIKQRSKGIISRSLLDNLEYWNDESRFREACFRVLQDAAYVLKKA